MTTLVSKDSDSDALAAHVVTTKGGGDEWVAQQWSRDLRKWGILGHATIRCDQESAAVDLARQMAKQRSKNISTRTNLEHPPVGESASNGVAEQAVQTVEGLVRTIKFDLEDKIGSSVPVSSATFAWLVEHAADSYSKFKVGIDGRTAYHRLKGKPWGGEVVPFGCCVHHRVPGKPRGGSLQPRWYEGIYLGSRFDSREHFVGLPDGRVVRAGTVEQMPEETLWNAEKLLAVSCYPGSPTTTVRQTNLPSQPAGEVPVDGPEMPPSLSRDMPVQKRHLDRYGYTDKCWKCRHMRSGDDSAEVKARAHSIACRDRIREAAIKDPEFRVQADAGRRRMG